MDSREIVCVDGGDVEVLPDVGAEVLGGKADAKGFTLTGPPVLLVRVQLSREMSTQQFSFSSIFTFSRYY